MGTKERTTAPKISVKIWRRLLDRVEAKFEAACLRRDAYLIRVLEIELEHLDREVSIPNSQASYDYVFETLDQFDRKLVSLALPTHLTTRINEICQRKRIVRDAFFNRFFLLLVAPPALIDQLYFRYADEWDWRAAVRQKFDGMPELFEPLFRPLTTEIDPFWALRQGIEIAMKDEEVEPYQEPESGATVQVRRSENDGFEPPTSLYTTVFQQKMSGEGDLVGLSCHLPDWKIPDHPAEREHREKSEDFWRTLGLVLDEQS
jgi:hypothetical protein